MISVYDNEKLVGFGRIVSDGFYQALICDLIVLPEYQSKGIGKQIMNRLLDRCKAANMVMVLLFSAKGKAVFYRKLGFVERPTEAPGMIWQG